MKNKYYYNSKRVELYDKFRIMLFRKLLDNYKLNFLVRKLKISQSMLYHYKNKRIKSIPLPLLKSAVKLVGIKNLSDNLTRTIDGKKLRHKGLIIGRERRKDQLRVWREDLPKISDLVVKGYLDLDKWFNSYQKLINFGCRHINFVKKKGNKIILNYTNYSKEKKKKFETIIPDKIRIDKDFQYFFGLWCGDRTGGGRFGVGSITKELNFATEKYLKKIYQKPIFSIMKSSRIDKLPKLDVPIDEIRIVKDMPGTYVVCVFAVNGFMRSFFHYLLKNLDEFLYLLPNKNIFFAGLFDAEGNVFLEDQCFRWACKNLKEVEIYKKHLKDFDMFKRYDGSNLVTYNKSSFSKLILPYLKHPDRVNRANLVCYQKGTLDKRFLDILDNIKKNPGITLRELSKLLNRKKIYAQVGVLERYKYVKKEGYPMRIYPILNEKKLKGARIQ